MAADFYTGEYGDALQVTMPFDASIESQTVVIEVRKPGSIGAPVTWSGGFTLAPTSVTRPVGVGELDVSGRYRCLVIVTRPSPARVRKVAFDLIVVDPMR